MLLFKFMVVLMVTINGDISTYDIVCDSEAPPHYDPDCYLDPMNNPSARVLCHGPSRTTMGCANTIIALEVTCTGGGPCHLLTAEASLVQCVSRNACEEATFNDETGSGMTVECSGDFSCDAATFNDETGSGMTVECSGSDSCTSAEFNGGTGSGDMLVICSGAYSCGSAMTQTNVECCGTSFTCQWCSCQHK
eukprot:996296_1